MSFQSGIFVAVQLAAIVFIIASGSILPRQPVLLGISLIGVGLLLWAGVVLQLRNLSVAPDVRKSGELITRGPYRFVRHPMYSAGLLVTLTWVISDFTWLRLLVWGVLAVDFVAKSHYEERLLLRAFSDYERYCKKTKRLIPLIY